MGHRNGLLAVRAHAYGAHGAADNLTEALDVGLAVLRQLFVGGALGGVLHPAGELLVNGLAGLPILDEGRGELQDLVAQAVGRANLDGLHLIQAVEVGHGHLVKAVEHGGIAQHDAVRPATATGTPGGSTELTTEAVQVIADFVILCSEGACTHAGGVSLAHADNAVDAGGGYAGTRAAATGAGVGAGDEGVGAEVDVKHGALSTLEENGLALLDGLVEHGDGVADVRAEDLCCSHDGIERDGGIRSGPAEALQLLIGGLDASLEHGLQTNGVDEVHHANADATGFVRIGGADALLGGADFLVAEGFLLSGVNITVDGQHNVCAVGDEQIVRGNLHALLAQVLNLLHQRSGVNHNTVADDVYLARPQNAGGNEVQYVFLAFGNHGVAGVAATLAAGYVICGFGKEVNDLALAFISPLGAYD